MKCVQDVYVSYCGLVCLFVCVLVLVFFGGGFFVSIVTKKRNFQKILLHMLTEFCTLISLDKSATLVWSEQPK